MFAVSFDLSTQPHPGPRRSVDSDNPGSHSDEKHSQQNAADIEERVEKSSDELRHAHNRRMDIELNRIFQYKRDLQNHFVGNDLVLFDPNLLLLDPSVFNPRSVLDARATPCVTASSKLLSDVELISTIRAMDIISPLAGLMLQVDSRCT